jgi:hypothetical protein
VKRVAQGEWIRIGQERLPDAFDRTRFADLAANMADHVEEIALAMQAEDEARLANKRAIIFLSRKRERVLTRRRYHKIQRTRSGHDLLTTDIIGDDRTTSDDADLERLCVYPGHAYSTNHNRDTYRSLTGEMSADENPKRVSRDHDSYRGFTDQQFRPNCGSAVWTFHCG